MLIPTKKRGKNAPFVLQLANNNLDNWKQMFLFFITWIPQFFAQCCPLQGRRNQIRRFWTIHGPQISEITAKELRVCVLQGSLYSQVLTQKGGHSFTQYYFLRTRQGNTFSGPHNLFHRFSWLNGLVGHLLLLSDSDYCCFDKLVLPADCLRSSPSWKTAFLFEEVSNKRL